MQHIILALVVACGLTSAAVSYSALAQTVQPAQQKSAMIMFGADWNMGLFATYYYGDHKP
jgi:hypothetical protein